MIMRILSAGIVRVIGARFHGSAGRQRAHRGVRAYDQRPFDVTQHALRVVLVAVKEEITVDRAAFQKIIMIGGVRIAGCFADCSVKHPKRRSARFSMLGGAMDGDAHEFAARLFVETPAKAARRILDHTTP